MPRLVCCILKKRVMQKDKAILEKMIEKELK